MRKEKLPKVFPDTTLNIQEYLDKSSIGESCLTDNYKHYKDFVTRAMDFYCYVCMHPEVVSPSLINAIKNDLILQEDFWKTVFNNTQTEKQIVKEPAVEKQTSSPVVTKEPVVETQRTSTDKYDEEVKRKMEEIKAERERQQKQQEEETYDFEDGEVKIDPRFSDCCC